MTRAWCSWGPRAPAQPRRLPRQLSGSPMLSLSHLPCATPKQCDVYSSSLMKICSLLYSGNVLILLPIFLRAFFPRCYFSKSEFFFFSGKSPSSHCQSHRSCWQMFSFSSGMKESRLRLRDHAVRGGPGGLASL